LQQLNNAKVNKKQFNTFSIVVFMLMLFTSNLIFAQTAKITGKVVDKANGETLIGLAVGIEGTTKGTLTDVEGRFSLTGLTAGKYNLTFRYLGYQAKTITAVEVKAGQVTTLDVQMEQSATQALKEVVVTASYKQETVGALYAQQKNSVSIGDGISSDVIKKSPDRNTGEVLKRVSGASVQDNKYIIIRGLSDRYNTALINNSPLPSSEPDRKAFSFDIIPSSLIDNVVISKTATPDLPGDFSGGAVQVKTKDFPDNRVMEFSYGMGYNSISTFKDFYGSSKNMKSYLASGSSDYALPSSFPSSSEKYADLSISQQVDQSKKFKNTWGVNSLGSALPSQSLQFIYGDSYALKGSGKIGFIGAVTYRTSESLSNEVRNDFDTPDGLGVRPALFNYDDKYFNFGSSLGVLANLAYINGNHKIGFKNIFNRSYEDSYLQRYGLSMTGDREYRKVSQQEVQEKTLFNSVLEGDHLLNEKNKSKLTWNLSFSRISDKEPDLRRLYYYKREIDMNDSSIPFVAAVPFVASASTAGRFFSDLGENVYGAAVNYSLPFNWLGKSQTFKAGLAKQYKERNVDARVLGYKMASGSNSDALLSLPQDQIFNINNIAADKFRIDDITNPANKYDGFGDLNAGYFMLNNKFSDNFKFNWGLRVENYIERLEYKNNLSQFISKENSYLDFLPSVNMTYELTPKANLRLSYSNTVARAQFRELAPFPFYDFVTTNVLIGNPDLKRTKISNVDARYEFYPSNGQVISFSTFYKSFKDPIEFYVKPGSTPSSKTMSYVNAPKANLYGVELELRHNLEFVNESSAFWESMTFSANAAVMKSSVKFENVATINNDRPMQGQSPYLINAGLHYSAPVSGWQTSLLYNKIGRRISVVGFGQYINGKYSAEYPDVYEAPRDLLDFQISKSILKKRAEVKMNISNILDSDARFYQDIDGNKRYNSSKDQLINGISYGRSVSLSFGYKF